VKGMPGKEALASLREGLVLDDGTRTKPARVRLIGATRGGGAWLEMVLTEGKNRQVRRMCGAVGHDVLGLVRVAVGGLALGDLRPGEWRRLEPDEVARLALPRQGEGNAEAR